MSIDMKLIEEIRCGMKEQDKLRQTVGKEIFLPLKEYNMRALVYFGETTNSSRPVFFDVHGGGFISGYPEEDVTFCERMAKELDITVISLEYRLAPEYPCPTDKKDVLEAIEYIYNNAEKFNIDKERMAIGGHSAGGNISAVVSMLAKEKGLFKFRCLVLDYPALDLHKNPREKIITEDTIPVELADLFNKCYCPNINARDIICSPNYATIEELRGMPPTIIITAERDSLCDEAEEYGLNLARAGVDVFMKRYPNVKHAFVTDEHPEAQYAIDRMIKFTKQYL